MRLPKLAASVGTVAAFAMIAATPSAALGSVDPALSQNDGQVSDSENGTAGEGSGSGGAKKTGGDQGSDGERKRTEPGPEMTPTPPRPVPTELALTVLQKHAPQHATVVTLRCEPPSGTHPNAEQACNDLSKVGGEPKKLDTSPQMCTMEGNPRTAVIQGTYLGKNVDFSVRAGNPCQLRTLTQGLFDFS